jgi:hypothetical protein
MKWILVTTFGLFGLGCASASDAPGDGTGGNGYGGYGANAGLPGAGAPNGGFGNSVAGGVPGGGGFTPGGGGFTPGGGGFTPGGGGFTPGGGGFTPGGGGFVPGGQGNGGGGGAPPACSGQNLLPVPDDPSVRGPWVVGVKTVKVGRLTAEVVYPAAPGSEQGVQETTYDIRSWLPQPNPPANVSNAQFTPIEDRESPAVKPIGGGLYRDLPIDAGHGPYPVVIFMHGTSSFRIASGSLNVQWASRGFVVVAADYPGLMLADQLCSAGCGCQPSGAADYPGDILAQINALNAPSGDIAFLAGHVDMTRVALSGHSVGGCTVAALSGDPNVQVVIPLSSAAPTVASSSLKSTLLVSGMSDTIFYYNPGGGSGIGNVVCNGAGINTVNDAYTQSAGPPAVKKRLVGITGGGHLVPTDLCQKNADGNNAIQVLHDHHYCGVDTVAVIGLPALFDCGTAGFDWQVGMKDVMYATTAALEETLTCRDRSAQFANMRSALPTIGDFKEAK